ncbi:competence protein ComK [Neobacillus bataviensis]|uniref:competence protein ComK n=1 Tax=Neobacillus bataviensis TaxID=220685 RepID=UPI0012F8E771|nr:competence protein ComK [Neobacillus bataviensis]
MTQVKIGEYVANSCTMYIKPVEYGNKVFSIVVEPEDEFLSPFKPLDLIKNSCAFYGVDYESRRKGTKLLIGYSRKLPIVIEPINNIYAFCTASPEDPNCVWFFLEHIKDYRRASARQTLVIFRNDFSFTFPISYSTFNTQMLRTSYLQTKLMQRVELNKKKLFYLLHGPKSSKASESSEFYLKDRK